MVIGKENLPPASECLSVEEFTVEGKGIHRSYDGNLMVGDGHREAKTDSEEETSLKMQTEIYD